MGGMRQEYQTALEENYRLQELSENLDRDLLSARRDSDEVATENAKLREEVEQAKLSASRIQVALTLTEEKLTAVLRKIHARFVEGDVNEAGILACEWASQNPEVKS